MPKKPITLRLDADALDAFDEVARARHMTRTKAMEEAMSAWAAERQQASTDDAVAPLSQLEAKDEQIARLLDSLAQAQSTLNASQQALSQAQDTMNALAKATAVKALADAQTAAEGGTSSPWKRFKALFKGSKKAEAD